ncbi:hypothetical protein [Rhodanobacter sp. L36]|uniref:hypothetical protein n=1 Tax=Rhodanobacter sp. L36 TaxID=1747221 RepID=UPI00131C1EA6|nr:hypothetical protein [Rhodanobacter sp. L36]
MFKHLVFAGFIGMSGTACAGNVHYVDVINTSPDSVASFAVASAGSNDFHAIPVGTLHGGGDSTTVAIRQQANECLHDLRTVFVGGRTLVQKNFNVCKYRSDHLGQYLRG